MMEETVLPLRQELRAIDEQISAVNAEIQNLCWRRSPEGNRRQASDEANGATQNAPPCDAEALSEDERRVPTAVRIASLRDELATALQRYMALQSQLHVSDNGLPR